MATLSHILLGSLLLASACTTQVGGEMSVQQNDNERADISGPDAAPRPDAAPTFEGACGEASSDAHFEDSNGNCYEYFFTGANWDAAQIKCQLLGGDLAKIDDALANGILASLVPTAFPIAWLRGTDEGAEGSWTWDGDALTYSNWRAGEPNNGGGNENCLVIESDRGGTWDDRACSAITSYICQR